MGEKSKVSLTFFDPSEMYRVVRLETLKIRQKKKKKKHKLPQLHKSGRIFFISFLDFVKKILMVL